MQQQSSELLLLFGSAFDDDDVVLFAHDDGARHLQLIRVRLHFEFLCWVRETLDSGEGDERREVR